MEGIKIGSLGRSEGSEDKAESGGRIGSDVLEKIRVKKPELALVLEQLSVEQQANLGSDLATAGYGFDTLPRLDDEILAMLVPLVEELPPALGVEFKKISKRITAMID